MKKNKETKTETNKQILNYGAATNEQPRWFWKTNKKKKNYFQI